MQKLRRAGMVSTKRLLALLSFLTVPHSSILLRIPPHAYQIGGAYHDLITKVLKTIA
jgi:hypothetical protein